jgi:hypothetical protein
MAQMALAILVQQRMFLIRQGTARLVLAIAPTAPHPQTALSAPQTTQSMPLPATVSVRLAYLLV